MVGADVEVDAAARLLSNIKSAGSSCATMWWLGRESPAARSACGVHKLDSGRRMELWIRSCAHARAACGLCKSDSAANARPRAAAAIRHPTGFKFRQCWGKATEEVIVADDMAGLTAELVLRSLDGSIHRMFSNRDL